METIQKICKSSVKPDHCSSDLAVVVFVVPSVISYFMPFVIGWIIAMIANPLVRFLDEKIKIRRKAGSAIVIIAVIAAIVAGIYGILSLLAGS